MAKLTPKEFNINAFNTNGEEYINGNTPRPQDFNDLAQGIAYLQKNGNGGGTTVTVNGKAVETFDADTKMDKPTNPYLNMYGVVISINSKGEQGVFRYSSASHASSIMARSANNTAQINTTEDANENADDLDIVNRGYVKEKLNEISSGSGGTVKTDKTLTIENAPADAKVVGDKLATKVSKLKKETYAQAFYQYSNSDGSTGVSGWKINGASGLNTNNGYGIPKNNYAELKRAISVGEVITDFSAPCGYVDAKFKELSSGGSGGSGSLYQHHVEFNAFIKYNPDDEWNYSDYIQFSPILRSAEALTLENFSERLSGITSIGDYNAMGIAIISVDGNIITTTQYDTSGSTLTSTIEITEPTDDFYWEITDIVTEIGE